MRFYSVGRRIELASLTPLHPLNTVVYNIHMAKAKRKGTTKQFTFTGLDDKEYTLTEKQKLFCEAYIDPFASGADAVIAAGYDVYKGKKKIEDRNMARVIASENLLKLNICAYLSVLLEDADLTDEGVDRQMYYIISQFKDLNAKNRAISEYNKIRGRHAPEKHEHKIESVEIIDYGKAKDED